MNYTEALEYIHSICWRGSRPGLERIGELCRRLGNPQNRLEFVHVAGTNGKGSVCSMLTEMLRCEGCRVGTFTSPYVFSFRERMCVDGEMISPEELAEVTEAVRVHADAMEDPPTEFELITAVAFMYFLRAGCDIVVLEAGLGGRLDCTNIIDKCRLSVICSIALDHTEYLGDTTEKIAFEKAGIIKSGCPVVVGRADAGATKVIRKRAEELGSPFYAVDYNQLVTHSVTVEGCRFSYGEKSYSTSLTGAYQPENAAVALISANVLGISEASINKGMMQAKWPARFEVFRHRKATVIFDGGHNTDGIKAVIGTLEAMHIKKAVIISAVMADKSYTEMARLLAPYCRRAYCTAPVGNGRALSPDAYAAVFKELGVDARTCTNMEEGLRLATDFAAEAGIPVLVCGSLYIYKEFREALERL